MAGRSNEALQLAKLILIDNPKRIFGGAEPEFGGMAFDLGPISRHASGTRGDRIAVRGPGRTYRSGRRFAIEGRTSPGRGISRMFSTIDDSTKTSGSRLRASHCGWSWPAQAQMTSGPGLSSGTGAGTGAGGFSGVQTQPVRLPFGRWPAVL